VLLLPAGAIDGDTYDAYVLVKVKCRLYGVNSPELHSADPKVKEKAVAAKVNLDKLLPRVPSRAVFHGKEKVRPLLVRPEERARRVAVQAANRRRLWGALRRPRA
jgi:endonuclease YncB( thermonuclease family)